MCFCDSTIRSPFCDSTTYKDEVMRLAKNICINKEDVDDQRALKYLLKGKETPEAPLFTRRVSPHYEFIIAIGKNRYATVTMSKEAYEELMG